MALTNTLSFLNNFEPEIVEYLKNKIYFYDNRPFDYELKGNPILKEELLEAVNEMNKLNKQFLLVDLNEYWECDIFNRDKEDLFRKLHDYLEKIISPSKVILMTEDCNFEALYVKWCVERDIWYKNRMNTIGLSNLFLERSQQYNRIGAGFSGNNFYKIKKYKNRTTYPNKNFMCLMGIYSSHRNSLQKFYNDNNLWDSNYISYIGNNEWKDPILLPNSGKMENIAKRNSTAVTDDLGYYFKDSYFSFIPESNRWTVAPNSLFLTEKTTKVLYHGHPFIIMSSSGALKQLTKWGFQTFPELFDESYDEIHNADERDAFIKNEILRVGTMNQDELRKICESVEDKCIHNQKVLLGAEKMIQQFMEKLELIFIGHNKDYFTNYKLVSKEASKYVVHNSVIYPDINRFKQDIADSLYPELFLESYRALKKQGKDYIAIIEDTEAHWMETNLHIKLHKVLEEVNIPPKKILFITNDANVHKKYDDWCEKMDIKEKINIIDVQNYLTRMVRMIKGKSFDCKDTKLSKEEKKKELDQLIEKYPINFKHESNSFENSDKRFLCLMGHSNPSRIKIWNFLLDNNSIKEQGYVSNIGEGIVLEDSYKDATHEDILCGRSNPTNDNLSYYYENSYFSLVPETNSGLMFSEKIEKPLFYGHPFIVFNDIAIGHLKLLKRYGFETFPEMFDESYDEIENTTKRIEFICSEVKRLCEMDKKELHSLCVSVKEKIIHNQNNLFSFIPIAEKELIENLKEKFK